MQRVSRAERLRRQRTGDRGFVYRRRRDVLGSLGAVLKDLYPMPGTPARDWPSAATVSVEMVVGSGRAHRLEQFEVRVKRSASAAEATRRALGKLRRPTWAANVLRVRPDGVPAVPGITALTYRVCPLFEMVKREVVDG